MYFTKVYQDRNIGSQNVSNNVSCSTSCECRGQVAPGRLHGAAARSTNEGGWYREWRRRRARGSSACQGKSLALNP